MESCPFGLFYALFCNNRDENRGKKEREGGRRNKDQNVIMLRNVVLKVESLRSTILGSIHAITGNFQWIENARTRVSILVLIYESRQ